jgi:excisionase family DNA binding protein
MAPTSSFPRMDAGNDSTPRALTVRVSEACRLTGIGRSKLYELIRGGEIRTIKVGAITLIPMTSLAQFLGLEHS